MWPFIGTATCQLISAAPVLAMLKFCICRPGTARQVLSVCC